MLYLLYVVPLLLLFKAMNSKVKGNFLKNSGKLVEIQEARTSYAIYSALAAFTFLLILMITLSY